VLARLAAKGGGRINMKVFNTFLTFLALAAAIICSYAACILTD